jgi:hypothetical protein
MYQADNRYSTYPVKVQYLTTQGVMCVKFDGRTVPHMSGEFTVPVPENTVVLLDSINVVPDGRTVLDIPSEVAVPDVGLIIMLAIEPELNTEIRSCLSSSTNLLSVPSKSASIWFNIGMLGRRRGVPDG